MSDRVVQHLTNSHARIEVALLPPRASGDLHEPIGCSRLGGRYAALVSGSEIDEERPDADSQAAVA